MHATIAPTKSLRMRYLSPGKPGIWCIFWLWQVLENCCNVCMNPVSVSQPLSPPLPSVWPHLFRGAGHEKRSGEQLKWSLAFRLYIGSFPCAQLPGPCSSYSPVGPSIFCVFSLGLWFVCSFLLFYLCVLILLCFPEQLSHLRYSFWR